MRKFIESGKAGTTILTLSLANERSRRRSLSQSHCPTAARKPDPADMPHMPTLVSRKPTWLEFPCAL